MDDARGGLSIRELAERAETTVRTIHYYIAEGLLPPPIGTKRAAFYSEAHVARLRLIAALREEGLALAAIRARLAPLTDEQAIAVIDTYEQHLARGDRSLTPLGLIEAALARETLAPPPAAPAPARAPMAREEPPQWQTDRLPRAGVDSSAAPERGADDSAASYLDRLLGKRPQPPRPTPVPRPMPPKRPEPPASVRPELWYHYEIADGIELRIREDRYRDARGQLRAVVDSLRPILYRYGLTHVERDDEEPGSGHR